MKAPNSKKKKVRLPRWQRRIGPILLLIILVPLGLFILGWQSRNLIIDSLQEWYESNHDGVLEIGSIEASFLTGFPNVGFTINDIHQSEKDSITLKKDSLAIDKATVIIGAGDLIRGDFRFKKITINNAEIYSEVVSDKSYDYHLQLKLNKPKATNTPFAFPKWLHPNRTKLKIRNLKYSAKELMFYKEFDLEFRNIDGELKNKDGSISGTMAFEATVNNLGFNTRKGGFLKRTEVSGTPKFTLELDQNTLDVSDFVLAIDDEKFTVNAHFDLIASAYHFSLSNDNLKFKSLQKFLSDSIAKKIAPFAVSQPLQTNMTLDGLFQFRNTPAINAQFSSVKNEVIFEKNYTLSNADFKGSLTNKLYKSDSLQNQKGSGKDIKIFFNEVTGNLNGMQLKAKDSYYQSTPEYPNFIDADLTLAGENESLVKILKNDNFDFRGGDFKLDAKVKGDIDHPYRLFNFAEGSFQLNNTKVVFKKNGLQLPVETINLSLENETSILKELRINLEQSENLVFTGVLENISSLISNDPLEPTTSFVQLKSGLLDVDELINTAKEMIPASDKNKDDRKTINEILTAIYSKFQPQFKLNLDTVVYNSIHYENFKADVILSGPETITLQDLQFGYKDSETDLKGSMIVPITELATKQPIYLNVQANSKGPIAIFKDLFDIKLVNINAGNFAFSGNIKGNIQEFNQLLDNSEGDLKLKNASFYYPNAGFDIDFDSLSVKVANSNIILDQVELEVGALHPFVLNGNIKKFPNILLEEQGAKGSVFLNVKAPFIDGDKWLEVVNSIGKRDASVSENKQRELSKAFKDINRLQPQVILNIDSLKYKDLITKEVAASVYFENDSVLKLDHLKINYKNSQAFLDGAIRSHKRAVRDRESNPFDFKFTAQASGNAADLNDYLKTVNFIFDSGKFDFDGTYEGEASDLAVFNADAKGSLKLADSKVNFPLADIQIPIDSLRLEINNDFANLETLNINLPGKSGLSVTGSIDNFSDFINNTVENVEHISTFHVNSSYLDTGDLLTFFNGTEKNTRHSDKKPLKVQNIKNILNTLNDTYYPQVSVTIDSLIHQDLALSDFNTYLHFDNQSNFKMEKSTIDFYEGRLSMEVLANISEPINLPVKIIMKGEGLNLKKLAEGLEYFRDPSLKTTDKLAGLLNFSLDATALFNDDGSVNTNSLNGHLQLNIQNLALYNYKPLMDAVILLKEDRFEKLEFRPIVQNFKIVDGEILIPRTEIQSSALHVFAEGSLKLNEYLDIWLSVPWKNLKANDGLTLPEKTSYKGAGAKFYVNLVKDQESKIARKQKLRFKIRLWNSKLNKSKNE